MTIARVFVAGAGGALGYEIVRILCDKGAAVQAAYRTQRGDIDARLASVGADPVQLDLGDRTKLDRVIKNQDAAIFTPILTISKVVAASLRHSQPAVFFSSNNVAIDPETDIYARLHAAETEVLQAAPLASILRPTMIYGYPGDGNLSRLMQTMGRFPFAIMPGRGKALQQPVYYRDLAQIAVNKLFEPQSTPRIRAVAGPSPVSWRELYALAANAAGSRPVILPFPAAQLAPALRLVERAGWTLPVTAAQLARAGCDKTPSGAPVTLASTPLEEGLQALAAALDAESPGA